MLIDLIGHGAWTSAVIIGFVVVILQAYENARLAFDDDDEE